MAKEEGRNEGERITVIANPRAGGGRAGAHREEIEAAVARAFAQSRVLWTERQGHAAELARLAAPETDILASLGGDGTCHEVVNGLFSGSEPIARKVVFAVLPYGTGGDLVRSLETPAALDRALWIASTGMTLPLDVGHMQWQDGREEVFINVAGVGATAEVCRRANGGSKRFGGKATFVSATLATLMSFRARPVRWSWEGPDGSGSEELDTLAAFCANGHYCGAGFWVGKGGSMADGIFELTIVPAVKLREVPRLLPRMYDGSVGTYPGVRRIRVTSVDVGTDPPLEADGETLPVGPVRIRNLPRILQVRGAWLRPPQAP